MAFASDDYDSPWKEALEVYLEDFFAFFFPHIHRDIDWSRGYTFLDKELQQVVRDAALGRRLVDKLVQVWRHNGEEMWVLVHIEIQNQEETAFAERMFVYHYRLRDRYKRPIVSLAVLGDERVTWRPDNFVYELWGCRITFNFPVVKLLDYTQQRNVLERDANPFATVVLAHLATQEARQNPIQRAQVKLALTRRLYELGYSREQIVHLFHFIDWLLQLPPDLEQVYWHEVQQYEEEQRMSYITSIERIGIEKGREEGREEGIRAGLLQGVEVILSLRFGLAGQALSTRIQQLEDTAHVQRIFDRIKTEATLTEIEQLVADASV
jgi:hypothetical protein